MTDSQRTSSVLNHLVFQKESLQNLSFKGLRSSRTCLWGGERVISECSHLQVQELPLGKFIWSRPGLWSHTKDKPVRQTMSWYWALLLVVGLIPNMPQCHFSWMYTLESIFSFFSTRLHKITCYVLKLKGYLSREYFSPCSLLVPW